ncbi:transposase [Bradyrhizobium sp. GM2.4]
MLLAERGYNAGWIRELARQQEAWANIPPRQNRKVPICFTPHLYRARNLIEQFFNNIKQCRRVAPRYDKLAANYLAFVKPASIRIWLSANESTAKSGVLLMLCGTPGRRKGRCHVQREIVPRRPVQSHSPVVCKREFPCTFCF